MTSNDPAIERRNKTIEDLTARIQALREEQKRLHDHINYLERELREERAILKTYCKLKDVNKEA